MAKTKKNDTPLNPKQLPLQVVVHREFDGDDDWLVAHEDISTIDGGQAVGIYQLLETKTVAVTKALV